MFFPITRFYTQSSSEISEFVSKMIVGDMSIVIGVKSGFTKGRLLDALFGYPII